MVPGKILGPEMDQPPILIDPPPTEGIKYAGSKLKLLPQILKLIREVHPRTVLDGFSGTTRVSQALAQTGYQVTANDLSVWSENFGQCYLSNRQPPSYYQPLIDHLNSLAGHDGWFTEHYGGDSNHGCSMGADGFKKPWQKHNTRRLDAIREEIDRLTLPAVERAVALSSLMLALDEVESTLGHFASYLNEWSPRSYKPMQLKIPHLFQNLAAHEVQRGDIFKILPHVEVDLAYFDPPYGSNNEKMPPSRVRYAAYYHLWTTVCLNDRPTLFGRAKRRTDSSDVVINSPFENFRRGGSGRFVAVEAIEKLLREVRAHYVILSYSSGGRATAGELNEAVASTGRLLKTVEFNYRRNVMAHMRWTNKWITEAEAPNREFLFLIEKR